MYFFFFDRKGFKIIRFLPPATDVSSKAIQKARQMAKRTMAAIACPRCKVRKQKCSDFRPCKHCVDSKTSCHESRSEVNAPIYVANVSATTTSLTMNQLPFRIGSDQLDSRSSGEESDVRLLPRILVPHPLQQVHPTSPPSNRLPDIDHHVRTLNALLTWNAPPLFESISVSNLDLLHLHGIHLPRTTTTLPLIPQAIVALLCDLTRPIPHPSPPPNALNMHLSPAAAASSPPSFLAL